MRGVPPMRILQSVAAVYSARRHSAEGCLTADLGFALISSLLSRRGDLLPGEPGDANPHPDSITLG